MTSFSDVSSGDHIVAEVKRDGNTYYKHGIFIGHEEGIIDLVKMKKDDLSNFNDNFRHVLVKITYPKDKSLSPQTVVENAKKMMNSREVRSHDIRCNDSEKYALTCKTGKNEAEVDISSILKKIFSQENMQNMQTVSVAATSLAGIFSSV